MSNIAAKQIVVKGVRLSFPALLEPKSFNGGAAKYSATFLLPKSDQVQEKFIRATIAEVVALKWKTPPNLTGKIAIKDGDTAQYDGYADHWFIPSSNAKKPICTYADKSPVEDPEALYPGCYVDVVLNFWAQDNTFGKRINANVIAVRFNRDGERFGGLKDAFGEEPEQKSPKVVDDPFNVNIDDLI